MPWRPPIMFWITVGQARRHTAGAIGPSTMDRSNLDAEELEDGWIEVILTHAFVRRRPDLQVRRYFLGTNNNGYGHSSGVREGARSASIGPPPFVTTISVLSAGIDSFGLPWSITTRPARGPSIAHNGSE